MRMIKKYPNRRLYDPEAGEHITQADLVRLIKAGDTLQVLDQKTQKDITTKVLLRTLADMKGASQTLNVEILHRYIKALA